MQCREEELRRPAPSETLPAVVRHVTCLPVGLPDEPGKREQSLGPGPPGPVSTGGPLARLISSSSFIRQRASPSAEPNSSFHFSSSSHSLFDLQASPHHRHRLLQVLARTPKVVVAEDIRLETGLTALQKLQLGITVTDPKDDILKFHWELQ